jgi:hypothetical protein
LQSESFFLAGIKGLRHNTGGQQYVFSNHHRLRKAS